MRRGEVFWAELGPRSGRRPVVVLTREVVIPHLSKVTVAPVTRTTRGIPSEVPVGRAEGLPERSVVSCDNVATIPKALLGRDPVGRLEASKLRRLDQALRFALGIRY